MKHRRGRVPWIVWGGALWVWVVLSGVRAHAQDAGAPERVEADAGVDAASEQGADASPDLAAEEAEIAAEMAALRAARPDDTPADDAAEPSSGSSGASASSRGLSNLMNPAMSANGSAFGGYSSRRDGSLGGAPDDLATGLTLQEVELSASAIVDPAFRADIIITGNSDGVGIEQAFLTTLELPHVTIRAGKFAPDVGLHNVLHMHAFPFITAPLPWRAQAFGPEGLRDIGVSADVLLPLPFYAELNAQVFDGDLPMLEGSIADDPLTPLDETVADQRTDRDLAYVGHLKTLFELGEPTTLQLGASWLGGRNGFGGFTNVVAGDVTLKWKPIDAERYIGFDWTTEYAWVQRGEAPSDRTLGGAYTAVRLQFAQRWWVQLRGALLGLPASDAGRTWRVEALAAFVPSEFSAIRLQYAIEADEAGNARPIHEVFAQLIFAVGPHPAHAY